MWMEDIGRQKSCFGRWWWASVRRRNWCLGQRWLESVERWTSVVVDQWKRLPLRIERSQLAGSEENSSGVSLLLLVLLGMYLKRQEKIYVRKWFKEVTKTKSDHIYRRSKLPGNGAKFRDRIHKELGNLINLIRVIKLGWLCLNVNNRLWARQFLDWFDWVFGT